MSLLCVNRRRSLRPLCRLRLRGRGNGGGEGFLRGLNASGGGCQRRFTPAQSRPVDEGPKVHVAPQSSVTGGKKKKPVPTFVFQRLETARSPQRPPGGRGVVSVGPLVAGGSITTACLGGFSL